MTRGWLRFSVFPVPGVVDVVARLVGNEPIIGAVVDALERKGRAELVALGGVVVDDVQDHLEPAVVQAGDHLLELAQRIRDVGGIARVWREEADRIVAPIVLEAALEQERVVDERMDGQKLDGRHPERADVVDDRLRPEPGVEAAEALVHLGMQLGEAFDVRFIDDRVVPGDAAPMVFAVPVEVGIDDRALRHERRAVALVEGQVVSFRADRIAEHGRVPDELAGVSARVRVEQELVRIEAVSGLGLERPVGAKPVEGAGADAGDVAVKDFVGVFRQLEPVDLAPVRARRRCRRRPGSHGRRRPRNWRRWRRPWRRADRACLR